MNTSRYSYEANFVHPATMKFLEENGYTYKHQAKVGKSRKMPDFQATRDDYQLILECKRDCRSLTGAIRQVREYGALSGVYGIGLAIVVPVETITATAKMICQYEGVQLIGVKPISGHDHLFWKYARKGCVEDLFTFYPLDPRPPINHEQVLLDWSRQLKRDVDDVFLEALNRTGSFASALHDDLHQILPDLHTDTFLYWMYTRVCRELYDAQNNRSVFTCIQDS